MTKEFAPGLALDTGEFIPASDLNAQMTAPPVPTSATWGNWREPTTVAQRLGDVLQLLCGGKRPPDDVVLAWLDVELGDIGLQHFCAQHGPAWAQGIGLIDLAMVAVAQPTDGVDHEQVKIESQVATAYAALPEPLEIDWPELHRQALGCGVEDRGLHNRYECAEYGWQDGVDKCVERVPEQIFDAVQMRAFADATCALRATPAQFARGFEAAKAQFASHGQAPAQSECLTCNDHGAVGNILTAEPCPDCTRKAAPAAVAGPSRDLHPEKCPITGRPFFMTLDHPELGDVPTYGGPYDSYTIPAPEGKPTDPWHERELRSERYDHDAGWWVEGGEPIPLRIVHEDVLFKLQEDAEAAAPTTQPAPQQDVSAAGGDSFLLLPTRPAPDAPANTAGLSWDAYSGAQMLAYGRSCSDAALVVAAPQPSPAAQVAGSVTAPATPPECETEAEKRAFAFGWFKALESERMKAESVQEDAARYRWLRENWSTMGSTYHDDKMQLYVGRPKYTNITPVDIDVAIDAASAAQEKKA